MLREERCGRDAQRAGIRGEACIRNRAILDLKLNSDPIPAEGVRAFGGAIRIW
jgi:hypothetical protein